MAYSAPPAFYISRIGCRFPCQYIVGKSLNVVRSQLDTDLCDNYDYYRYTDYYREETEEAADEDTADEETTDEYIGDEETADKETEEESSVSHSFAVICTVEGDSDLDTALREELEITIFEATSMQTA